ncbi:MAG: DUF5071 domain-containing protein [Rhodobacteraceae bacterium]|nr:DUF5071 domain-containing protein [Paracoccaceae bacterium]
MSIQHCIPKNKHDLSATYGARELGFPAVNEVLPELLEWLQDANWPVAWPLASILQKAGTEIVLHIRKIFAGQDDEWKFSIVVLLLAGSSQEVFGDLQDELLRLAQNPSEGEKLSAVDEAAKEVLKERFV